jgi:cytochrome bd ubiquinol oxidase subunit I
VFHATNWWQVVFNPSFPYRLAHMVLAAFITTCFVVGGVSAIYLLRGSHTAHAELMLKLAVAFAAIAVPAQIIAGDLHGLAVHKYQPVKLAAIEAIWETERGAPLLLFAWPDQAAETNRYAVGIPRLGSLIITHEADGEIVGLKSVPARDRPPVAPVFFGFRIMVGIGLVMLAVTAWSAVRWRQGRLIQSRKLLRAWALLTPMGFVAVLAGWYTTEIGRQPYVIHGLMRTSAAASNIALPSLIASLATFASIYLFVFTAGTWYLLKLLRRGPQPLTDDEIGAFEESLAKRPLGTPREAVDAG